MNVAMATTEDKFNVIDQLFDDEEEGLQQSISRHAVEMPLFRSVVQEEITLASDTASRTGISATPISTDPDYYEEPKDFQRELKRARVICTELSVATRDMINDVRVGRTLDVDAVTETLDEMVASVLRHPCAFVWAARLHTTNTYLFSHPVRCAIFCVVFGRRLGLKPTRMKILALAGLLCQIGKTKLPSKLLEKQDVLSAAEMKRIQCHVDAGVEILTGRKGIHPEVVEVVQNHCERFNGTGYPQGKKGDEIPLLSRIVGLVDSYDAMTSVKPHTDKVMSIGEINDYFHKQRDTLFQGQLVEEFIQAFGMYPTGTLVELSNGQVALVRAQIKGNRLQPRVLLILDKDKQPLEQFASMELPFSNENSGDLPLNINRTMSINEIELDSSLIKQHYAKKKGIWAKFKFDR